jgi:hypothetical protein
VNELYELVVRPVVGGSAAPVELHSRRRAMRSAGLNVSCLVWWLDFRRSGLWPSRARNCLETKGMKWATNVAARRIPINGVRASLSKPSCLGASGHLERCGHMRKPCNCRNSYRSLELQTSARAATLRPARPPYERGCGQHQMGAAILRAGTAVARSRAHARARARADLAERVPQRRQPQMRGAS